MPLVAIVISGHWFLPDYGMRWTHTAIYYALTIAGQTWLVRLCVNLRRLAEISERERIADELHDVLGEALSKITLKAQFAGRLLEQKGDCDRAATRWLPPSRSAERRSRTCGRPFANIAKSPARNRGARHRGTSMLQGEAGSNGSRGCIRVVIAEDQAMVLGALAALLEMEGDIKVIAQVRNGREAYDVVNSNEPPDVLITDIEMPEMTGLEPCLALEGGARRRR